MLSNTLMMTCPSSRLPTFRCRLRSEGTNFGRRKEENKDEMCALVTLYRGRMWRRKAAAKAGMQEQLIPMNISSTLSQSKVKFGLERRGPKRLIFTLEERQVEQKGDRLRLGYGSRDQLCSKHRPCACNYSADFRNNHQKEKSIQQPRHKYYHDSHFSAPCHS